MKGSLIYSLVMLVGVSAHGQSQVANENKVLAEAIQQPVVEAVNEPITTQSANQSTNLQVQQPVILQNQPTNNVLIQKQPTTVVEESPLVESRAEALRKQRIELEQGTEALIVERLEAERIKAEHDRAQKLLKGLETSKDSDSTKEAPKTEVLVAPVAVESATVLAPNQHQGGVQVISPQDSVLIQQNQVQEVKASEIKVEEAVVDIRENESTIVLKEEIIEGDVEKNQNNGLFIGLDLGFTNYSLDNVNTLGTLGVSLGKVFDEKYVVEGGYSYSRFDIESVDQPGLTYFDAYYGTLVYYPVITEMRQHNFTGSFKYKLFGSNRLSPYAGGLISFTYRDYDIVQDPVGYANSFQGTGSSIAMDLGLIVGADLKMTDSFGLNFDMRYVTNLSYEVDADGFETSRLYDSQFGGEVIEEAGYWQFFVGGKLTF